LAGFFFFFFFFVFFYISPKSAIMLNDSSHLNRLFMQV